MKPTVSQFLERSHTCESHQSLTSADFALVSVVVQSKVLEEMRARRGLDARTALLGPGGHENLILNIEVEEPSSMSRIIRGCRRWVWVWGGSNPLLQTQTPQIFFEK